MAMVRASLNRDSQVEIAEDVPLPAARFFRPKTPAVMRIEMIKMTTRISIREKPEEALRQE
jgi:hypothetical protein